MMQLYFDDSPTQSGHNIRGIGVYTRNLKEELQCIGTENEHFALTTSAQQANTIHYPYFDFFAPTLYNALPLHTRLLALLPKKIRNASKAFLDWLGLHTQVIVVTIHDVIPLEFPSAYPKGIKGSFYFWLQKRALGCIQGIVTDSMYSKQKIAEYFEVNCPIQVVPLAAGFNTSHIQPLPSIHDQSIAQLLPSIPNSYILYVGDINYNKNLPALIRSIAYIPDHIDLVLVGKNIRPQSIPEWDAITNAIESLPKNDQDRIRCITDIPKEGVATLAAIYACAEVYVQPSLSEGFGLPVLEAMFCKTPVVAADTGSLPEVVGTNGILVAPTPADLANGINQILQMSSTQKKKLVESAYSWAHSYSWQKTAQQTVDFYMKLHTLHVKKG